MAAELPIGLESVSAAGSADVAAYWVPVDKDGVGTAPVTADAAVIAARSATDVFLMSHGWNNDSVDARERYLGWIGNLLAVRPAGRDFRPVFVGIFWPSMVAPSADGELPVFAGGAPGSASADVIVDELADRLGRADAGWLVDALSRPVLDGADAVRAAGLLLPLFAGADHGAGRGDGELPDAQLAESVDDVVAEWFAAQRTDSRPTEDDDEELTGRPATPELDVAAAAEPVEPAETPTETPAPADDPLAAGIFEALNPAWLARLASVLVMKDRSGRIGAGAVSDLLDELLGVHDRSGRPRIHLLGHSFGCKVMLSALVTGTSTEPVDSILLLQPALNARAFAADAGNGKPGGYRPALQRSRSAIVATYSSHDMPLTKVFHLAARRRSDLGEVVIAAGGSKYAALGGFGPQRVDDIASITGVVQPPHRYPTAGAGRILAVDASEVIGGHGDVVSPATAWMLASQLAV